MAGITRRHFATVTARAVASLTLGGGCYATEQARGDARISARPRGGASSSGAESGPLGLDARRDGILHLPGAAAGPLPLLLLLHGAGGRGAGILERLKPSASDAGLAILAPDARGATWDAIGGRFGPDVAFIDRALERVFERVAIDPARVAIGGFSDGASYALSVGLVNGSLFRRIIAFSPGFYVGGTVEGRPRIFISHGTADEILPIDQCSRLIVPKLKAQGYEVTFRQFAGGHEIPAGIAREGMKLVAAS